MILPLNLGGHQAVAYGVLDAAGNQTVQFVIPPSWAASTRWFAYFLHPVGSYGFNFASNPVVMSRNLLTLEEATRRHL